MQPKLTFAESPAASCTSCSAPDLSCSNVASWLTYVPKNSKGVVCAGAGAPRSVNTYSAATAMNRPLPTMQRSSIHRDFQMREEQSFQLDVMSSLAIWV